MALQVSTVRNEFALLKRDLSDVGSGEFIQWCKLINNYAYSALKKIDPERFIDEVTMTVSSGSYPLPVTFGDIKELGCGVYDSCNYQLSVTGYGSKSRGYYIKGGNIIFTGISSESVTIRFIPKIIQITGSSDYFTIDTLITGSEIIEEQFLDYVLQALDVKYSQWDSDLPSEGNADQRFVRVLNDMLSNYSKTTNIIVLPDISNHF